MLPAMKTAPAAFKNAAVSSVAMALSPTQVSENKITEQLPLLNQMDSRQSNQPTAVSKQGLLPWNQILKHRAARSPLLKKITHFEASPAMQTPASPNTEPPAPPTFFLSAIVRLQVPGSQLRVPSYLSENKIAGQLQLSNQMDSRQSNLSTTVSKQALMPWNQMRIRQLPPRQKRTLFPNPLAPLNKVKREK
jgi:hypothetical protein